MTIAKSVLTAAGLLSLSALAIAQTTARFEKIIAEWPERPRLAAAQMLAKYGEPDEASSQKLVWMNEGAFRRISVSRREIPHNFPKPHYDYLEHTVAYRVPVQRLDALASFDGSVTVDRTAGELSARCDLEEHNILALNLANSILGGKLDPKQAREAFGRYVVEGSLGQTRADARTLQFQSPKAAGDPDRPTIPGASMRATGQGQQAQGGDAEVLGMLLAVNENEIMAAREAQRKQVGQGVGAYAKMLQQQHGQNLRQTMQLAQKIKVTPLESAAVEKLRARAAGELAALVPLQGERFARGFSAAMLKQHSEVLQMIDNQLLKSVQNEELRKHVRATRQQIVQHRDTARKLQEGVRNEGGRQERQ